MPRTSSQPPCPLPPPPRRSAAEIARARRLELGISQFTVAARAGISLSTYSLLERGGIITAATAEKIASVLGLFPEELLQ